MHPGAKKFDWVRKKPTPLYSIPAPRFVNNTGLSAS